MPTTMNQRSKKLITQSLKQLVSYGANPKTAAAWDEARMALGQLGDTVGQLLANKPQEDVAFSSALSSLDGYAETLRRSPSAEARNNFELSLGDVEYRVKRLFGVSVR